MDSASRQWSTPMPAGIALIGAGLALAAAAAASYTDPPAMVFIGVAAVGLLAAGAVALIRRPRLALLPGPALRVRTLTGAADYPLADIARVSLLETRRLAGRSKQMLIDLQDDRLLVFGRWDLGEDPGAVAEVLHAAGFPAEPTDPPEPTDPVEPSHGG